MKVSAKSAARIGLVLASALALGACSYDNGYGSGGVSVGYGSGGYYGYGDPYYGGYGPAYGWYDDYYYPGSGYWVYDRGGGRHRWTDRQRAYWRERHDDRQAHRGDRRDDHRDNRGTFEAPGGGAPANRNGFRADRGRDGGGFVQDRAATRPGQRADRNADRPAFRQGDMAGRERNWTGQRGAGGRERRRAPD